MFGMLKIFLVVSSWYQVINDLLDPTGQNLRVREDVQVQFLTISSQLNSVQSTQFTIFILSVNDESLNLSPFGFLYMNTDISSYLGMESMYYV